MKKLLVSLALLVLAVHITGSPVEPIIFNSLGEPVCSAVASSDGWVYTAWHCVQWTVNVSGKRIVVEEAGMGQDLVRLKIDGKLAPVFELGTRPAKGSPVIIKTSRGEIAAFAVDDHPCPVCGLNPFVFLLSPGTVVLSGKPNAGQLSFGDSGSPVLHGGRLVGILTAVSTVSSDVAYGAAIEGVDWRDEN